MLWYGPFFNETSPNKNKKYFILLFKFFILYLCKKLLAFFLCWEDCTIICLGTFRQVSPLAPFLHSWLIYSNIPYFKWTCLWERVLSFPMRWVYGRRTYLYRTWSFRTHLKHTCRSSKTRASLFIHRCRNVNLYWLGTSISVLQMLNICCFFPPSI